MSRRHVRKAIFPVAGLGTRMLPASKAIPKEMLPVVDRPLIQYAVEEAQDAGIEEFFFITGHGKEAIADHFDPAPALQQTLKAKGRQDDCARITGFIPPPGRLHFIPQGDALGLGHAVRCARDWVGDEFVAILSPDDLILSPGEGCLSQLLAAHRETGGHVVAVMDVPRAKTRRYGVLDTPDATARLAEIRGLVEKPTPRDAPSTLCMIGRYILGPDLFRHLDGLPPGHGGEIQLTDGMAKLIGGDAPFHGLRFTGERFDCGDRDGWLAANLAFALARDDSRGAMVAAMRRHGSRFG